MAGDEDDIGIPAGADAAGSTGVPGAFTTTDAEGSDGSEAGVATALADAVVEEGAASCGCLEQAASANNDAIGRSKRTDFMADLSKSGSDRIEAPARLGLGCHGFGLRIHAKERLLAVGTLRALSIEEEAGDHSGARRLIHCHRDVLNCGLNGETCWPALKVSHRQRDSCQRNRRPQVSRCAGGRDRGNQHRCWAT